ncbi:MAG: hypothetical protein EXS08_12060 [Planctomycetes bacterium]|nr:hypothetical protein [Planctomycetota bacterium]
MLVPLLFLSLATLVGGDAKLSPVAGASGDFLRVAHVRIDGSSFEIGRALARLGSERHGARPPAAKDKGLVRAQREYFAAHAPTQLERMRGVADFFGHDLAADAFELDAVAYAAVHAGCTVVFYPPDTTTDGRGVLARNFDFTTGTLEGKSASADAPPASASPYVLELHPTDAYASLAVVSFDLLGVLDGVNSQGLTVALLADDELTTLGKARPSRGVQAGFDVLQVGRFLLDTCKDVPQAEAALRGAKLYYASIPCHYLVADASGRSFVWENAIDLSGGHVIEGDGGPQVTTNYLQQLHPDPAALPADRDPLGLFGRQKTLLARFVEQETFSLDEIRANARCVAACAPAGAGVPPNRTLWHALYFPAERRMEIDFYLGESSAGAPRRSAVASFALGER